MLSLQYMDRKLGKSESIMVDKNVHVYYPIDCKLNNIYLVNNYGRIKHKHVPNDGDRMLRMKLHIRQVAPAGLFAALTATLSQVVVAIPVSPVPITLQVFSVSLAGVVLGSKLGGLSQLVYVLLGTAGIPVFAGFEAGIGIILGPKGGYIIGFPLLAYITGFSAERQRSQGSFRTFFSMLAGLAVFYVIGAAWLGTVMRLDISSTIVMGVGWFLPVDIIKLVLASITGFRIRKRLLLISNSLCRQRETDHEI